MMRTWGRVNGVWTEINTDANGNDDAVWITTFAQALQLIPGESPFFANYGIPAQESVATQIFPDYYVALMQSLFAPYFAKLTVVKNPPVATDNPSNPSYTANIVTHRGVTVPLVVGI